MILLVDMNLSPRWIEVLRAAGLDALHWSGVGLPTAPDTEIMDYAMAKNCVVLTHDLDFGGILAANQGRKPSVVQIRADDIRPETIGNQVIAAIKQMKNELDDGALLTVDPRRVRLTILPLRRSTRG